MSHVRGVHNTHIIITIFHNLEFATECTTYPVTSTTLGTLYYHGICYVLKKASTTASSNDYQTMCTDFPQQPHKHLAFPSNDKLFDWLSAKVTNTVCCVQVCECVHVRVSDVGDNRAL
jgi:hypothetical protein